MSMVNFRDFLTPLDCLLSELSELFFRMQSLTSPLSILYPNDLPSKIKVFNLLGNWNTIRWQIHTGSNRRAMRTEKMAL